jgi:hypothetical protein
MNTEHYAEELKNIINTIKMYYNTPPSEKIMKYLILFILDFDDLKKRFPRKINPKFIKNVDGDAKRDSIDAGLITDIFPLKSKRNHILNLAYEDEFYNFFTDADRKELSSQFKEYGSDEEEKTDVIVRVDMLRLQTKKKSNFPYDDLINSFNVLDEK